MVLCARNETTGALKISCNPRHEEMPRHLLTALFPKTRGRLALQVTACLSKIGSSGPQERFFLGRSEPAFLVRAWNIGVLVYQKVFFRKLTEVSH